MAQLQASCLISQQTHVRRGWGWSGRLLPNDESNWPRVSRDIAQPAGLLTYGLFSSGIFISGGWGIGSAQPSVPSLI